MFGGKELQDDVVGGSSLEMYDFGARNYDPALGRWFVIDALADAKGQIHNTPYGYVLNNPIVLTDPDGNCPPGVDCLDPVPNVDIVSSGSSGKKGGTFGHTRNNGKTFHSGIDLRASKGTNLVTPLNGKVVYAKNNHSSDEYSGKRRPGVSKSPTTGYGNAIVVEYTIESDFDIAGKDGNVNLKEGQKVYIRFTHMDSADESLVGEEVNAGDSLGETGATGNAGLQDGEWGISPANRHTHMEVSTSMSKGGALSKDGMIDASVFINSQVDSNGNVKPPED